MPGLTEHEELEKTYTKVKTMQMKQGRFDPKLEQIRAVFGCMVEMSYAVHRATEADVVGQEDMMLMLSFQQFCEQYNNRFQIYMEKFSDSIIDQSNDYSYQTIVTHDENGKYMKKMGG